MSTGAVRGVLFLSILVVSGLMNNVCSQPAIPVSHCEKYLEKVLVKPKFSKLVQTLFDNQVNESGFVYSELTLYHQVITMYALGSEYVRQNISKYLGLNTECDNVLLCASLDNIIQEMNDRQSSEIFHFVSQLYHQNNTAVKGLDACASERQFDFKRNPVTVLSDVNRGYKQYCTTRSPYLQHKLSPKDVFFLLDAFRVTSGVYGKMRLLETGLVYFYDVENIKRENVTWLEMPGPWWYGCYTPHREGQRESECPLEVQIHRSEINNGTFYMLYFKPKYGRHQQTSQERLNCLKEVLLNIRVYIDRAIKKQSGTYCQFNTFETIAVPLMDLSTGFDLETVLKDQIRPLFEKNEIAGISNRRQTANDLLSWDYMRNGPENIDDLEETEEVPQDHLERPFIYALVDKSTKIILKAGTFLRP